MTEQRRNAVSELAEDPSVGRRPTSHERTSGRPWDSSYHDGPAPWDIGRAQSAILRVGAAGGFVGAVLDVGCGTGDNTLHIASLRVPVLGVDVAETALGIARSKAAASGIDAEFATGDALELHRLGRTFDTVVDCGLFHTLDGDERRDYVASLASVTKPDGTLFVLSFSDDGPVVGPHPVTRADLTSAFDRGQAWRVAAIEADRIQTRYHHDGLPAWLATVKRI